MSKATEFETLLYEEADGVATVTINRPQAMNSFNDTMIADFSRLWSQVRCNDAVRAVILRAAPGRAYSTGADVKTGIYHEPNIWSQLDPGTALSPKQNKVWKPVIAAVHGLCAGGAFYWINESDIVICSEETEFFDPHVTYGMTAALEPIGLARRVPLGEALRIALLGNDERITAATALRIGLVSEITALDQLWARAKELAGLIAAKPAAATQGTVRAIWESLDLPRSVAANMGLLYTQIGNPIGRAQVDRKQIMSAPQRFTLR